MSKAKSIEKVKLGKKRRGSDIFRLLPSIVVPEFDPAPKPKSVSLLGDKPARPTKNNRPSRNKLWNDTLEKLKKAYPPEFASQLNKKKRKPFAKNMSSYEYMVFCSYVKTCRRGAAVARRLVKKQSSPRRIEYATYINSPLWTAVKNRYYRNHPRRCAACDSYRHINLHHMVYANFGNEPDDTLIPLCADHHKAYHDKYGTSRNMIRTTTDFISDYRLANDL